MVFLTCLGVMFSLSPGYLFHAQNFFVSEKTTPTRPKIFLESVPWIRKKKTFGQKIAPISASLDRLDLMWRVRLLF